MAGSVLDCQPWEYPSWELPRLPWDCPTWGAPRDGAMAGEDPRDKDSTGKPNTKALLAGPGTQGGEAARTPGPPRGRRQTGRPSGPTWS